MTNATDPRLRLYRDAHVVTRRRAKPSPADPLSQPAGGAMRNLKRWVGAALLAQPFYADEIRMIGLMAQTFMAQTRRFGLPNPRHRRPGS